MLKLKDQFSVEDGREGSVMLSLLHQRVTKGSRRRSGVNSNGTNNFNEEKRKGLRVERMSSEEKGGRRSAEEREGEGAGRRSEERDDRRSVEERRGARVARRRSEEERRSKGEAECSLEETGEGSGGEKKRQNPALISSPSNSDMSDKEMRRRRKEGEARSDTMTRQKKKEKEEGLQPQSLAPLSPAPDYPSLSPRLSRSIQCLATLGNLAAER